MYVLKNDWSEKSFADAEIVIVKIIGKSKIFCNFICSLLFNIIIVSFFEIKDNINNIDNICFFAINHSGKYKQGDKMNVKINKEVVQRIRDIRLDRIENLNLHNKILKKTIVLKKNLLRTSNYGKFERDYLKDEIVLDENLLRQNKKEICSLILRVIKVR